MEWQRGCARQHDAVEQTLRGFQTVGSRIPSSKASFNVRLRLALRAWAPSTESRNFRSRPFFSLCIILCTCSSDNWFSLIKALIVFSDKASTSAYKHGCVRVTERYVQKQWTTNNQTHTTHRKECEKEKRTKESKSMYDWEDASKQPLC